MARTGFGRLVPNAEGPKASIRPPLGAANRHLRTCEPYAGIGTTVMARKKSPWPRWPL